MNKFLKKIIVLLTAFVLCFTVVGCEGCNSCNPEEGGNGDGPDVYIPDPAAPVITLDITSKDLTIGDYLNITATTANLIEELAWTSSNPDVASVDGGLIEAINEGRTTITAKSGDVSATCEISVGFNGQLPELDVLGGIKDSYNLTTIANQDDVSYTFVPVVNFNKRTYTELDEVSFESDKPEVLEINNEGVAKAKTVGEATVTISGKWKGKTVTDSFLLSKSFKVIVGNDVIFNVNNATVTGYDLTAPASFLSAAEIAANAVDFVPTVSVNGAESKPVTDVTNSDSSVATIENGKIVPKKMGTTTIVMNYSHNGVDYSKSFAVRVSRLVEKVEGVIDIFSAKAGTYKTNVNGIYIEKYLHNVPDTWADKNVKIVDAYQGDTELIVGDKQAILGVSVNKDDYTNTSVVLGTETECYEISIRAAGYYIFTAKDFKNAIDRNDEGEYFTTGYNVLLNNIDASGIVMEHSAKSLNANGTLAATSAWSTSAFKGTFEGNGYFVSNLTVAKGGVFGNTEGANIKNVAFINLKPASNVAATYVNGCNSPFLIWSSRSATTVDNVYIKTSQDFDFSQGLIYYVQDTTKINNVFIDYPAAGIEWNHKVHMVKSGLGSFLGDSRNLLSSKAKVENVSNVVVVSPMPLAWYSHSNYLKNESGALVANENGEYTIVPDAVKNFTNASGGHFAYAYNETKLWADPVLDDEKSEVLDYAQYFSIDSGNNREKGDYKGVSQFTGVYRYDTLADMVADENLKLDSFSNSIYWKVINGTPVWAQLVANETVINYNNAQLTADVVELENDKTAELSVVSYNGAAAQNAKIELLSGSTLTVNFNAETKVATLTPVAGVYGDSIVRISYDLVYGEGEAAVTIPVIKDLKVIVTKALTVVENLANYDASNNDFVVEGLDLATAVAVRATMAGETYELTYDASANKIYGLPVVQASVGNDNSMVVEVEYANGVTRYSNAFYWTKLISNAEEFKEVFDFEGTRSGATANDVTWFNTGFYALDSDIDFENKPFKHHATYLIGGDYVTCETKPQEGQIQWDYDADDKTGFAGLFDGQGHVMTNFDANDGNTTYKLGLFGKLYADGVNYGATVRNFAVVVSSATGGIIAKTVATKGVVTIENVYTKVEGYRVQGSYKYFISSGLIMEAQASLVMNNVVVDEQVYDWKDTADLDGDGDLTEVLGGQYNSVTSGGALFGTSYPLLNATSDANITNVYVLSKAALSYNGAGSGDWKKIYSIPTTSGYEYNANSRGNYVYNYVDAEGNAKSTTYRTYVAYAANETQSNVPFITGFNGTALTLPTATDDADGFRNIKNYTWGYDDLSSLESGVYTNGTFKFSGVKKYDGISAMVADAANNASSLAGFDSAYWNVVNGVPLWKTL